MLFDHLEEKEAVKKAALIEENGHRFYSIMAGRAHSDEARDVFKRLAKDELKHLRIIEKKFFPEAGFGDKITEEELAIEEYVEKSFSRDVFTRRINVEALVDAIDTPKKALMVALDTEIHSAEYFETLSRRSSTPEGRKIYGELAVEERSHVEDIESLIRNMP